MADALKSQSCETCRFFRVRPHSIAGIAYAGRCVRYPPSIPDEDHDAQFPSIHRNSWCGEYVPANPQTVTEGAVTMARLVLLGDMTAARALADSLKEMG